MNLFCGPLLRGWRTLCWRSFAKRGTSGRILSTFHVVAIPRLMNTCWRRLFNKVYDFTFSVSPGTLFWPTDMYKPLWIGIVLPFTHHRPWCFKRAPLLVALGRDLRAILPSRESDARHLLRKLLQLPKRIAPLSELLTCGVLRVPGPGAVPSGGHSRLGRKPVAQGAIKAKADE